MTFRTVFDGAGLVHACLVHMFLDTKTAHFIATTHVYASCLCVIVVCMSAGIFRIFLSSFPYSELKWDRLMLKLLFLIQSYFSPASC